MTAPPTLILRHIGETENALRAVLVRMLAGTGLDYHRWVGLQLVAQGGPGIPPATVRDRLQGGLKIDRAAAEAVIEHLRREGLVDGYDQGLTTTAAGAALFARIMDQVRLVSGRIWSGLDTADLAAAARVLATIRKRANAVLAA